MSFQINCFADFRKFSTSMVEEIEYLLGINHGTKTIRNSIETLTKTFELLHDTKLTKEGQQYLQSLTVKIVTFSNQCEMMEKRDDEYVHFLAEQILKEAQSNNPDPYGGKIEIHRFYALKPSEDLKTRVEKALVSAAVKHDKLEFLAAMQRYLPTKHAQFSHRGVNPLWIAQRGYAEPIAYLNRKGINIHDPEVVAVAAEYGHLDFIKELASNGVDILADEGEAACVAASNGHAAILEYLMDQLQKKHPIPSLEQRIAYHAAQGGHLPIFSLLDARNYNLSLPHPVFAISPIYIAVQKGHTELVKYLCEKNVYLHDRCEGKTLLHLACRTENRRIPIVQMLVEYGLDVNALDLHGQTPFHMLAADCDLELIRLFIAAGAFVNLTDKFENTAAHEMIFNRHKHYRDDDIVEGLFLLDQHGCDLNHQDTSYYQSAVEMLTPEMHRALWKRIHNFYNPIINDSMKAAHNTWPDALSPLITDYFVNIAAPSHPMSTDA